MTDEEKADIRKQHEEATKKFYQKIADEKAGLKAIPKEEKKSDPSKKETEPEPPKKESK
jgi:hypothetical protein